MSKSKSDSNSPKKPPTPMEGESKPATDEPQAKPIPPGTDDPVSLSQESNTLGVAAGALAGGAAAGALGAAVGGPAGAAVGSALGAVAGGLGARTLSEAIDSSIEVDFWTDECTRRDYYDPKVGPEPFLTAYRIGFENHNPKVSFEQREPDLKAQWEASKGFNQISWSQARRAMQDAWTRVDSQYRPNDM